MGRNAKKNFVSTAMNASQLDINVKDHNYYFWKGMWVTRYTKKF
jgi:hypothetical protein